MTTYRYQNVFKHPKDFENNKFTSQKQQNPIKILSGVHGDFKVINPSRFSDVQKNLKPWLTIIAINFRVYPIVFPTKKKLLFAISYLDKTTFDWVQPRLEKKLENDNKKQKQETQQMFYKFDNFCIYIKEVFGNQDEDRAIEKQLLILKQTQLTMVYGSRFKILIYTIKWDCKGLNSDVHKINSSYVQEG